MDIPFALLDQIQKGQTVLFLGSAASLGAEHPRGEQPPLGGKLAKMIDDRFLGGAFPDVALDKIAELAISETDLIAVQEFIADIFTEFKPGSIHKIIPTIPWKAIATTNYDLIIERAYDETKDRVQQAVTFKKDGEKVEHKLTLPNHFPYLKLHGCITEIHNNELPLILTPEQYITHRNERKRLFTRLQDLAYEYPIIFAGYSLADPNIRAIMLELEQLGDSKPRSYLVTPRITEVEKRMWAAKKITPIEMTFEQFLTEVDGKLGAKSLRQIVANIATTTQHPIARKFSGDSKRIPSEAFWALMNSQVEFIHSGIKSEPTDPKAFYKGYFQNWSPIEAGLDAPRSIAEDITVDVFLEDEKNKVNKQELVVIKGYAGSGKSVLLKRIAWNGAITLDKLCISHTGNTDIDVEAILELYALTKERIFLFIDSAAKNFFLIRKILDFSNFNSIPITITTSERYNEWNESCLDLNAYITAVYELNYLNRNEIIALIALLEKHKSLGHLESLSPSERIQEFEGRAERQLLVALHEVTYGKPFSDIVINEYNSIKSHRAKLLYITVAVLHRLGVRTRAGVISRLHNISFSSFKEELFSPLQYIVFDEKDRITGDIYYRTRHQHIADVLFEQVLLKPDDRFYHYVQIISALNTDYESDRDAFRGMTRAKELTRIFGKKETVADIFSAAQNHIGRDANLLQQQAIFEMSRNNLSLAEELLIEARDLAPWNKNITHSLAELQLKLYNRAKNDFEREKYRRSTLSLASKLTNVDGGKPHAHHTLLKLGLLGLEEALEKGDVIETNLKIKDFELGITNALRDFPNESFILDAEAQYKTLVNKHPEALLALEKAFQSNKKIAFVALRLATTYASLNRSQDAIRTLKECAQLSPLNKDVNYRLARLLIANKGSDADIKHYLRESFVKGGSGYEAQFLYARILYIEGNFNDANQYFKTLASVQGDIKLTREPREILTRNDKPEVFRGTINSIHAAYAFLTRDGFGDKLFMHRDYPHGRTWTDFRTNQRVKFNIGFTYKGPVALNVNFE